MRGLKVSLAMIALTSLTACASGGQTTTGNATGGTVSTSVSVGDVCAGMTANCVREPKSASTGTQTTTTTTGQGTTQ
jgi:hypothetical protein